MRGPLIHRFDQSIFHHPGFKKGPDEFERALVRHPCGHLGHQAVVLNSVEEFLQIKIDDDIVTLDHIALGLGYSLMSRAPRSEAVAVLGKCRIPTWLKDLQQGLLDQSIDDTRHAEFSDPTVRFRQINPLDRLWLVDPFEQLRSYGWPVLAQVGLSVLDGHPIDTRAAFIPTNTPPRYFEIGSITYLLHEIFCYCRAFGCWCRHRWFGLLDLGVWGKMSIRRGSANSPEKGRSRLSIC